MMRAKNRKWSWSKGLLFSTVLIQSGVSCVELFAQAPANRNAQAGRTGAIQQPIQQPRPNTNQNVPNNGQDLRQNSAQNAPQNASQNGAQSGLPNVPQGGLPGAGGTAEEPPVQIQHRPELPPAEAKYVRDVLNYWQQKTSGIQRYSCAFNRWEFDPALTNGNFHNSVGTGELRYMRPDKGVFKVEQLNTYVGKDPSGQPKYEPLPNQQGEWWLCDGSSVHSYDRTRKEVTQYQLPPSMQGLQIVDSPLPFVFGIEAEKVLQRYWVEPVPPPAGTDLMVLKAYPKRIDDAVNYKFVEVFLDRNEGLPVAIRVFKPQWREDFPVYEQFEFRDRQIHDSFLDKIKENLFMQAFIPAPPKDWKVIVKPFEPASNENLAAPDSVPPQGSNPGLQGANQAQRVAQPLNNRAPNGNR